MRLSRRGASKIRACHPVDRSHSDDRTPATPGQRDAEPGQDAGMSPKAGRVELVDEAEPAIRLWGHGLASRPCAERFITLGAVLLA